MLTEPNVVQKRALTLYFIIGIKLLKGLFLLALAIGVYALAGQNLDLRFDAMLRMLHLDPDQSFFMHLGERLLKITPSNVRQVAAMTFCYSFFSFAEAAGLMFRLRWVGWIVIGESLFFIPIEVYELIKGFSIGVSIILVINVIIVEYLYRNRNILFRHHHRHPHH